MFSGHLRRLYSYIIRNTPSLGVESAKGQTFSLLLVPSWR